MTDYCFRVCDGSPKIVKSPVVSSVRSAASGRNSSKRSLVRGFATFAIGKFPAHFGLAKVLGPSYSLRCVVFHDISESESSFTKGMGVTISPSNFESALRFIAAHYHPVSLGDVLDHRRLPERPVLLTFDDGYASVLDRAVPVCKRLGIPATLFLNSAFLDNKCLSPDNLVCYVANIRGMGTINNAARIVLGKDAPELRAMMDVFRRLFTTISLTQRAEFLEALRHLAEVNDAQLAAAERLYLTSGQVRALSHEGFEIGNHTTCHVHCRNLRSRDRHEQIDRNKMDLEKLSGRAVRSFSVPYGSSIDLSNELTTYLRSSGHQGVFLSEGVSNTLLSGVVLDRVGVRGSGDETTFVDLEVLPRLRFIRNRLRRRKLRIKE